MTLEMPFNSNDELPDPDSPRKDDGRAAVQRKACARKNPQHRQSLALIIGLHGAANVHLIVLPILGGLWLDRCTFTG
jgi:hypothetical protein